MLDRLRVVGPADRVLHIKSLPMWQDLSTADVLPLALAAREDHFEPGDVLLRGDKPAPFAFLLVDGRVRLRGVGSEATVDPPHGVGFLSVLTREHLGVDVEALTSVVALRIAREDLQRVHEDSFRLFERCLRQIASLAANDRPSLTTAALAPRREAGGRGPRIMQPGSDGLDFAERLLWLSEIEPFRSASVESIAEITRRQTAWTVGAGETIWRPGEPSSYFLGLVDGALRCELDSAPGIPVRSDWLVGLVDALAEQPRSCRLVAGDIVDAATHGNGCVARCARG